MHTLQDIRFALRGLLREPSFTATAVLTLAIGVGATTAMFTVVNAVVLRPLPFDEPERIAAVMTLWTKSGARGTVSAPDFHDWAAANQVFEAIAYYTGGETAVAVGGSADYASVHPVTPEFFRALGARPALGRLLAERNPAGDGSSIVITDAFWRRHFAASPEALGRTVKFRDHVFTIVGVLPPGQRYPAEADIFCFALAPRFAEPSSRSAHNYRVVARLRPGVTFEQATLDMTAIAQRLEQQYPASNSGKLAVVAPLKDVVVGSSRSTFDLLLWAVALVLIAACANVANLLLARSSGRAREMVVRAALGADRGRLVRQLLTESLLLALLAGALGAWLARWGVSAFLALAPPLPRLHEVRVDSTALLFALAAAALSTLVFGLAPALQASRVQLAHGLRQGGKGTSIGGRTPWARSAFVVAQIALSVVLVMGAALLARSLAALAAADMGFAPDRLLVLRTAVPVQSLDAAPRAVSFYETILADLRTVPGVSAAGAVTSLPTSPRSNGSYWVEGGPGPEQSGVSAPQALFIVSTPGYFRALGVPLRRGRDFAERDRYEAPFVAIINESLARASFADRDPIGRRIQCGLDSLAFMTIVGVVADVRTEGPGSPARPEIYMPYLQHPGPATALNIVVRTETQDPLSLADTLRRKVSARNSDVPVKTTTMAGTLEGATATPRFRTWLMGMFAGVGLLLAVAGVYGVMAYNVSRRVPELGVRVALGASPASIMRLVLIEGGKLTIVGVFVGVALAVMLRHVLSDLLFGVGPLDPATFAAVAVTVVGAMFAASYLPARRAVQVDPMTALRDS